MRMNKRLAVFAGLPLLAAASACATNALRVEYAEDVATQGKAAGVAARAFLNGVDLARQDLAVDLISIDRACARPGEAALIRQPPNLQPNRPSSGWLCVPVTETPGRGNLRLDPISDDVEPALALIDALVTYADALGEIVAPNPVPPDQEINEALGLATAIQGTWLALSGGEDGPLTEDRRNAIGGFIAMLVELQREQRQVDQLREAVARHPDGAQPLIRALRQDLQLWEARRRGDSAMRTLVSGILLNDVLFAAPERPVAARREALTAFYTRRRAQNAANALHPALVAVLDSLDAADRDFRRLLAPDPTLTREERARIAEIGRRRITRALQSVTALISAFRGM